MATQLPTAEITPRHHAHDIDPAIVKLLAHRYGDGLVYLRGAEERKLYARAVGLGLITRDGYVTREGRALIANYGEE